MRILGIDPGSVTSGWALFDTAGFVEASGEFPAEHEDIPESITSRADAIVLERPRGYGPSRPDVVECAIVFGDLRRRFLSEVFPTHEMLRKDVCATLTDAVHGVVRVKNDTTAWAALVAYFGDGSDRKPKRKKGVIVEQGGVLGEVKGHARAALAVAVAWWLKKQQEARP